MSKLALSLRLILGITESLDQHPAFTCSILGTWQFEGSFYEF